jgi:hypothetical protein
MGGAFHTLSSWESWCLILNIDKHCASHSVFITYCVHLKAKKHFQISLDCPPALKSYLEDGLGLVIPSKEK